MSFIRYILMLCLAVASLCGCVRQPADAARVEVLRQGQIEEPEADVNIHPAVYVNVRDNTNKVFGLRTQVETWLQRQGYTVVPNPSEAGYILQIVVLAAGTTAPETARQVVTAGYDAPSQLSGKGGTALVADVLLVQRHVPSTQGSRRTNLKNHWQTQCRWQQPDAHCPCSSIRNSRRARACPRSLPKRLPRNWRLPFTAPTPKKHQPNPPSSSRFRSEGAA